MATTSPDERHPAPRHRSWWSSTAGTLTAVTAFITALAGLLAALREVGVIGKGGVAHDASTAPVSTAQPRERSGQTPDTTIAASGSPSPSTSVATLARTEATLRDNRGEGTYTILAAQVVERAPQVIDLRFSIRLYNKGPSDIEFWSDSFRLLVDGVPRAPTNSLITSVDARSAKEAELIFDLPKGAKLLALRISLGTESADLPITLAEAK